MSRSAVNRRLLGLSAPPNICDADRGRARLEILAHCLRIVAEMETIVDSVLFRNGIGG
jgi:hypothetical protein